MKLAMIAMGNRKQVAVIDERAGLTRIAGKVFPAMPVEAQYDMTAAIQALATGQWHESACADFFPLDSVQLLAPIPNPRRNVMCVGKNYRSHAREFSRSGFDASGGMQEIPEHPIVFTKAPSSVTGPGDDIPLIPGLDAAVDYEAELAIVIGVPGRFISRENAMRHVFGYTVLNDVTARDLQKTHKQWFLGKAIDGFCPTGPWIVTADELDANQLRISCRVNGELRQDATTADLIFDIPAIIETISRSLTLLPGDIIATGTPDGVGIGFNPPRFLKDGDVVECSIAGIGAIRNTARRVTGV
jgi:2-keto-4-pentenoate hydratase/2-oxohepta-3-ene-1,7-dioic acid hydratase in catechol pathway